MNESECDCRPHGEACIDVSFDVDQISSDLAWNVENARGDSVYSLHGRYAGAVRLDPRDPVHVRVTGYGPSDSLLDVQVVEAMLYAVPYHTNYWLPSPFSTDRAATVIGDWTPSERAYGKHFALTSRSRGALRVIHQSGRWQLSLVLTVRIVRRALAGEVLPPIYRVFSFDPETEIGSGTEPDRFAPVAQPAFAPS